MSWYDPRSWITSNDGRTVSEINANTSEVDAKLRALNTQRATVYGPEWYAKTVANDAQGDADSAALNQSIIDEFKPAALITNLSDSASTTAGGLRNFLEPILSFPLKIIPPTGWLIIGFALFIYLGGGVWLRGILARK